MTQLRTGNRLNSGAGAINNAGVIAGVYTSKEGGVHACYWDAHGMHQLRGQARYGVEVEAIDDRGNIVGAVARTPGPRLSDPCIWRQGRLTLLPVPCSTVWSIANAMNERGVIVGWVEYVQGHRPCIWRTGKRTVFHPLGTDGGEARSINDSGIIVGETRTGGKSRAVAWLKGRVIDLNSTITHSDYWTLEAASCVNSRGQIVGWGMHKGHRRGFLLTPIRR